MSEHNYQSSRITSQQRDNHTFYFIKFPLGAGGTHLSNMISLSPIVNDRFKSDNYIRDLELIYTNQKRHVHSSHQHIISDLDKWQHCLDNLDYTIPNSIHIGHAASFGWAESILQTLINKKYINIVVTTDRSIQLLRQREFNIFKTDTFANRYYQKELIYFYNKQFDSTNSIHWPDEINFSIELEDLYTEDITDVILSINEKYALDVPEDQVKYFQKLWIKKQTT